VLAPGIYHRALLRRYLDRLALVVAALALLSALNLLLVQAARAPHLPLRTIIAGAPDALVVLFPTLATAALLLAGMWFAWDARAGAWLLSYRLAGGSPTSAAAWLLAPALLAAGCVLWAAGWGAPRALIRQRERTGFGVDGSLLAPAALARDRIGGDLRLSAAGIRDRTLIDAIVWSKRDAGRAIIARSVSTHRAGDGRIAVQLDDGRAVAGEGRFDDLRFARLTVELDERAAGAIDVRELVRPKLCTMGELAKLDEQQLFLLRHGHRLGPAQRRTVRAAASVAAARIASAVTPVALSALIIALAFRARLPRAGELARWGLVALAIGIGGQIACDRLSERAVMPWPASLLPAVAMTIIAATCAVRR